MKISTRALAFRTTTIRTERPPTMRRKECGDSAATSGLNWKLEAVLGDGIRTQTNSIHLASYANTIMFKVLIQCR